jgi:hypothetical protein
MNNEHETTTEQPAAETQAIEKRPEPPKPVPFHPTDMGELYRYAGFLANSRLVPRVLQGAPQDVLLVLLKGNELGLKPMQSLGSIHIVDGKAEVGSHLLLSLVLQSGACEYFRLVEAVDVDEGEAFATYETRRKGWPEGESSRCTWTLARAQRAGLTGKNNWKSHTLTMLKRRAQAELCRDVYPDVVAGMYDFGEIVEAIEDDAKGPAAEPSTGIKARARARKAAAEQAEPPVLEAEVVDE